MPPGTTMKPIFNLAKRAQNKRVAYAEGEEERVLRAAQIVVDEALARPTLIGRPDVIASRIAKFGLRLEAGRDYDVVNTDNETIATATTGRRTTNSPPRARASRSRSPRSKCAERLTLIGSMLLHKGEVDGMLCGTWGNTAYHLNYIDQVIGAARGRQDLRLHEQTCCCPVGRSCWSTPTSTTTPTAEQLADITTMAAEEMVRLGLRPKAALLSHSNFGSSNHPSARQDARHPGLAAAKHARGWKSTAKCTATPHSTPITRRGLMPMSTPDRRSEPAGAAQHRCRQHRLQPAEDSGRRRHRDRPGAAGCGQTGAYLDCFGHGAAHRQHDRLGQWLTPTPPAEIPGRHHSAGPSRAL